MVKIPDAEIAAAPVTEAATADPAESAEAAADGFPAATSPEADSTAPERAEAAASDPEAWTDDARAPAATSALLAEAETEAIEEDLLMEEDADEADADADERDELTTARDEMALCTPETAEEALPRAAEAAPAAAETAPEVAASTMLLCADATEAIARMSAAENCMSVPAWCLRGWCVEDVGSWRWQGKRVRRCHRVMPDKREKSGASRDGASEATESDASHCVVACDHGYHVMGVRPSLVPSAGSHRSAAP